MKAALWLQSLLYIGAGINHFWHPGTYRRIMPPYLPYHAQLITISGLAEIVLGVMLLFQPTRNLAAYLIIAMLVAFIPAHIYWIEITRCKTGGFCMPSFIAWIRLIPGQLLLILWAYSLRNL